MFSFRIIIFCAFILCSLCIFRRSQIRLPLCVPNQYHRHAVDFYYLQVVKLRRLVVKRMCINDFRARMPFRRIRMKAGRRRHERGEGRWWCRGGKFIIIAQINERRNQFINMSINQSRIKWNLSRLNKLILFIFAPNDRISRARRARYKAVNNWKRAEEVGQSRRSK